MLEIQKYFGPTDQPTNKVSSWVACTRLKTVIRRLERLRYLWYWASVHVIGIMCISFLFHDFWRQQRSSRLKEMMLSAFVFILQITTQTFAWIISFRQTRFLSFSVAHTRLYTLLCPSVCPSVILFFHVLTCLHRYKIHHIGLPKIKIHYGLKWKKLRNKLKR